MRGGRKIQRKFGRHLKERQCSKLVVPFREEPARQVGLAVLPLLTRCHPSRLDTRIAASGGFGEFVGNSGIGRYDDS